MNSEFLLLNKSIFFKKQGILALSDLHLGYEKMLKDEGITFSINQLTECKKEIEEIINQIKKEKLELKKILLLGDIKQYFGFERTETNEIRDFLNFLEEFVDRDKIIIVKGNHERFSIDQKEFLEYYLEDGILFFHGDSKTLNLYQPGIKTLVMGHLHPAAILEEGVKKEKYKCYLIGNLKDKQIIILPSFLQLITGTEIDEEYHNSDRTVIPREDILKLDKYIIGENKKIYEFKRN